MEIGKLEKRALIFACGCIVLGFVGITASIIRGGRYGK